MRFGIDSTGWVGWGSFATWCTLFIDSSKRFLKQIWWRNIGSWSSIFWFFLRSLVFCTLPYNVQSIHMFISKIVKQYQYFKISWNIRKSEIYIISYNIVKYFEINTNTYQPLASCQQKWISPLPPLRVQLPKQTATVMSKSRISSQLATSSEPFIKWHFQPISHKQ